MIPNIEKGTGVTGAVRYVLGQGKDKLTGAWLTLNEGETSRAQIIGGQNFPFTIDSLERLDLARRMMEFNAHPENQASKGRLCEKDCLHASLAWEPGYEPSKDEMVEAARGFLKALGMETAQAVFIAHTDTGHKHIHIVASRIDPKTGKTFSEYDDQIKAQRWALRWERERNQLPESEQRLALHRLVNAITVKDTATVLDNLTQRSSTFTKKQLETAIKYSDLPEDQHPDYCAAILAHKNVLSLKDGKQTVYTTQKVLDNEGDLLRDAASLRAKHGFAVDPTRRKQVADSLTLTAEQRKALEHLTQDNGFAVLWGQAGTGKSHTMKAVRQVYEAEGKRVIGMAWKNDVVNGMAEDGFKNTATIASALSSIQNGKQLWDNDTVLIIDEAAMLATKHFAALAQAADRFGAKLIPAGDDKQLGSIERGGMFEKLREAHGAATLAEVQRVQSPEAKAAWNQMHRNGDFRPMLQFCEQKGAIHIAASQEEAMRELVAKYTADCKADPHKTRFMFAQTNQDVDTLNAIARAHHKQAGRLGADHTIKTASGNLTFAEGDRIQFTGTGYGIRAKKQGLINGYAGTITGIQHKDGQYRLTVSLDAKTNAEPKIVTFDVGPDRTRGEFNDFKHGYAGTIYKLQGRTLDQAYALHSAGMRRSASYVALSRHREDVHIFGSRATIRKMDGNPHAQLLDVMARGMGRNDIKRAASSYELSDESKTKQRKRRQTDSFIIAAMQEGGRGKDGGRGR